MTILVTLIYPHSRGTLRLANTDPTSTPLIDLMVREVLRVAPGEQEERQRSVCGHGKQAEFNVEDRYPAQPVGRAEFAYVVDDLRHDLGQPGQPPAATR